ncbi:MAG: peptidoglycan-binding protein [Ilumatobacteraceae bacterium]
MSDQDSRAHRPPGPPPPRRRRDGRLAIIAIGGIALTLGAVGVAVVLRDSPDDSVATTEETAATQAPTPSAAETSTTVVVPEVALVAPAAEVVGEEIAVPKGGTAPASTVAPASTATPDNAAAATDEPDGCRVEMRTMRIGEAGADVECLQVAMRDAGLYDGQISASYDNATADAVSRLQTERNLFVDGEAGRETAKSLGIWPDEASLVVRTPQPPEGAEDTSGFPLSPVAVSGADSSLPPLPAGSGSGRRVVYERAGQRVWAVDDNNNVIRSWLVSGSQYENEVPGTHSVYSRSEASTAWNGKAILPLMIRWYETDIGNLGFHGIPIRVADGSVYQTTDELGTRLSGGCQRQHNTDADFMWNFATVGTTVVVI